MFAINVYHHFPNGEPQQGRLHPVDLQLIKGVVLAAISERMDAIMAQIEDLLADLNAITTDVANEVSAHLSEVQQLEDTITDLQNQLANNQPVDLTEALALTSALRQRLEGTVDTATQASEAAQTATDSVTPASDSADAADATDTTVAPSTQDGDTEVPPAQE